MDLPPADKCKICGKKILPWDENATYQDVPEYYGDARFRAMIERMIPPHMRTAGWMCGRCHEIVDREMFGHYVA